MQTNIRCQSLKQGLFKAPSRECWSSIRTLTVIPNRERPDLVWEFVAVHNWCRVRGAVDDCPLSPVWSDLPRSETHWHKRTILAVLKVFCVSAIPVVPSSRIKTNIFNDDLWALVKLTCHAQTEVQWVMVPPEAWTNLSITVESQIPRVLPLAFGEEQLQILVVEVLDVKDRMCIQISLHISEQCHGEVVHFSCAFFVLPNVKLLFVVPPDLDQGCAYCHAPGVVIVLEEANRIASFHTRSLFNCASCGIN